MRASKSTPRASPDLESESESKSKCDRTGACRKLQSRVGGCSLGLGATRYAHVTNAFLLKGGGRLGLNHGLLVFSPRGLSCSSSPPLPSTFSGDT